DAGWSAFVAMLEYKATKHGRLFLRIGRFEPTTRTCSGCGWYGPKLDLSIRTFRCARCPLVLDRDVNAARNILAAGRKLAAATRREAESLNACGAPARPGGRKSPARRTTPASRGTEAGTHRKATTHSGDQAGIPGALSTGRTSTAITLTIGT
ncbi:MAG TPA: transposase, partial [Pseudonocardiaceae bacterium]